MMPVFLIPLILNAQASDLPDEAARLARDFGLPVKLEALPGDACVGAQIEELISEDEALTPQEKSDYSRQLRGHYLDLVFPGTHAIGQRQEIVSRFEFAPATGEGTQKVIDDEVYPKLYPITSAEREKELVIQLQSVDTETTEDAYRTASREIYDEIQTIRDPRFQQALHAGSVAFLGATTLAGLDCGQPLKLADLTSRSE